MPPKKADPRKRQHDPKNLERLKNSGKVAEAILGAALVAKLIARSSQGKVTKITPADVKKSLKLILRARSQNLTGPSSKQRSQVKMDAGGMAKDKIRFTLVLDNPTMDELMTLNNFDILTKDCQAATNYCNSPRVQNYAEMLFINNINNQIDVDVDGVRKASTTKSDIDVIKDGEVLDQISLKAGSKKSGRGLGMVGGKSWSGILQLFSKETPHPTTGFKVKGLSLEIATRANEKRYLGLVSKSPNENTVNKAVRWAYTVADDLFNKKSGVQKARAITDFIGFHATRNDPRIRIVSFHLGAHKVMQMKSLEENVGKMKNVRATTVVSTQWPQFIVYDADAGPPPSSVYKPNCLFVIRPMSDARKTPGYITHRVEQGPLLEHLMETKEENVA